MKRMTNCVVVATLIVVLLGGIVLPARAANAVTDTGVAADVTIISYNVLTTSKQDISASIDPNSSLNRGQKLIAMLQNSLPDSAGLCEVTEKWLDYLQSEVVKADYGEAQYALAGLVPTSSAANGGRLSSGSGEYSPILFRVDKYELIDEGGYWFSGTPDVPSKWNDIKDDDGNVIHAGMKFNRVMAYCVCQLESA